VLALYGGGVLLRTLCQIAGPLLVPGADPIAQALRLGLAASGPLTLAGAALGVWLLAVTARHGPPLRTRPGLVQVLPLLVASWVGLLAALAANAFGTLAVLGQDGAAAWLAPPAVDGVVVRLALLAWLVPVAVAFSARNFPLFVRTPLPSTRALNGGLALLLAGVLLDAAARLGPDSWAGAGALGGGLEGAALIWLTVAIGALGPKVRIPGRMHDPAEARLARATAWPLIGAYAWLAAAGALLLAGALAGPLGWLPPPEDAARHALGAGFVLLLIVGMALRLLPGFAGVRHRLVDPRAAWLAIWLAHAAALLRVGPPLAAWLLSLAGAVDAPPGVVPALTASGLAGGAAVAALAVALRVPLAPPQRRSQAG
jgi:uncharacterized protein involved in response to NO